MWPPVGQRKEDDSSNDEAAAAESDSGDSLFITQKPVPAAVRSGRRHQQRQSDSTSSSSESEAPLSSPHPKSSFKMDKETRKKYPKISVSKYSLPRYSFPFLEGRRRMSKSTMLPMQQNTSLHNSVMGGFFECVREQWQGFLLPSFAASSLPTVDKEGQCIPPLSEDEEDRSEDEDIKVVPKKCFVASTKAKSKQTWCDQVKEQLRTRREAVKARHESSQEGQQKMLAAKASTSRMNITNDKNCLTQTVSPGKRRYLPQIARNELCSDSDVTDCELQRSPRQNAQKGKASATDVSHTDDLSQTEDGPESQNLLHGVTDHFTDTDNDNVCGETTVKEREKDHGSEEEEEEEESGQIQEEAEGLHAATSVNEEVEETSASQATDELESNDRNCTENLSLDDAILIQEEGNTRESTESDVRMEDSVFSVSCEVDNDGRKRKRSREDDEDVEQLQSSADTEPLNDNAEIQKKRKKEIVLPEGCEEEEVPNRVLDMRPVSTGKSEKSGDCSENTAASNGATQDGDNGEDVNFSNDAVTLAISTEVSLTKRKKKKKKTVSDGQDISDTSVENEMFENVDNIQETTEGPQDKNAELMMKKKKTVSDVVDSSFTSEENEKLKHVDDTQKAMKGLKDQNTELETPKKKKKKKKMTTVSDGEDISHTLEENDTIEDLSYIQKATESPKDQNAELETPKKKKKKKKKTVSDEVDISCTYEENEKIEKVDDTQKTSEAPEDEHAELETPKRKKKKKKTVSDEVDSFYTSEENEKLKQVDDTRKAMEGLEDQNTELETPKKKKKKKIVSDEVDISNTISHTKDVDTIQKMMEGIEEQNAELETPKKKKRKEKTLFSEVDISYTSQENEMAENVDTTHKTTEGLEDQNTEVVTIKKKKKKKKMVSDEVEDVDNIQKAIEGPEHQNVELVTSKKKKTVRVEISYSSQENEKVEVVDNTQKTSEGLDDQNSDLVSMKKKKRKKKMVCDEEDVSLTLEETEKVGNVEDTEKTTESLEDQNAEVLSKKKKKKKKKTLYDGKNIFNIPEENKRVDNTEKAKEDLEGQNPELVAKKKKKKKIGEIMSRNISEDSVAQSDDSVSVQKKEKKRTSSFLVADAEENNVQTYRGQKSSSPSVDAHVWGAQKAGVSAGGFQTESAEITGSLEETNDGVRQKQKKRKRKMSVE